MILGLSVPALDAAMDQIKNIYDSVTFRNVHQNIPGNSRRNLLFTNTLIFADYGYSSQMTDSAGNTLEVFSTVDYLVVKK